MAERGAGWHWNASKKEGIPLLSPKLWRMLQLLAVGWNNVAIANELGISTKTVENYTRDIYEALGVKTEGPRTVRVLAARWYWKYQERVSGNLNE
jgi:DNA-binding NarL/FixJ family response regulator